MYLVGKSKDGQQTVVIVISLLIIVLLSPSCPTACVCVYVHVRTCVCGACYFSLACSSPWQPNYHFQQYANIQIENCTQECSSFLTGWWFMRCFVGRDFLSFFLFLFVILSTMGSYLHSWYLRWEEPKGWAGWRWSKNVRNTIEKRSLEFFWLEISKSKHL